MGFKDYRVCLLRITRVRYANPRRAFDFGQVSDLDGKRVPELSQRFGGAKVCKSLYLAVMSAYSSIVSLNTHT